jgi:hypothetical protein
MTGHGMPQPTEEHRKLQRFAGRWAGDEMLSPSEWGPGGPARGRYALTSVCDGFFLTQEYEEEKDGRTSFRGHGVLGYDARAQEYTWYWVDSMGMPPAAASRGRWEGDTLVFQSAMGPMRSRYTWRFTGPDTLQFRMEMSPDGSTWKLNMEGNYQRQR